MKDSELKQVQSTLAFLRSVILSGESMTEEVRTAINEALEIVANQKATNDNTAELLQIKTLKKYNKELRQLLWAIAMENGGTLSVEGKVLQQVNNNSEIQITPDIMNNRTQIKAKAAGVRRIKNIIEGKGR